MTTTANLNEPNQNGPATADSPAKHGSVDEREALVNHQKIGPIYEVQIPRERITTLHAIMWDLDPDLLVPDNSIFTPSDDPEEFYHGIKHVLDRHPLARFAEVRATGRGLHLLLWLKPPVEMKNVADQKLWSAIVRAVQCSLPADPDMPGITAVTRPIGSVNGKNQRSVRKLVDGSPVSPETVEEFVERLAAAPFREVATALFGEERVQPCPICRGDGTRLDIIDFIGSCYGSCGKFGLDGLLGAVYQPRPKVPKASAVKESI